MNNRDISIQLRTLIPTSLKRIAFLTLLPAFKSTSSINFSALRTLCKYDWHMLRIIRLIIRKIDALRLNKLSRNLINLLSRNDYAHGLTWFGARIFQTPTDLFLYQQLIFKSRPNVIIETGVAKGGSVLFACQMLDLLHGRGGIRSWNVICCDINPMIEAQGLIKQNGYEENVIFFQGDSASTNFNALVLGTVKQKAQPTVLLSLDSNHTEEHVYAELVSLANFVTSESYVIVWDSRLGDLTNLTHYLRPRPWGKGRHAGTGAELFMASDHGKTFAYEKSFEKNLLLTGVKNGVLQKKLGD